MRSIPVALIAILSFVASPTHGATPNIRLEQVARKVELPLCFTHDGTPRRFIVEQPGRIRLLLPDGTVQREPFLDIKDRVYCQGEMGLLGLAFHPDFAKNGYFYLDYTVDKPRRKTIIAEYYICDHTKGNVFRIVAE